MRPGESFIQQPVRSLQTMLRVLAEDDSSLPSVVPDGIYGPTTAQAVSTFQRKYGLPVTGVTNQQTWEEIVNKYEPALVRVDKAEPIEIILNPNQVFRRDDTGPYIYLLQAMLAYLSNTNPAIEHPDSTGVLDGVTANSLAAFQALAGLPSTGEFDKVTWKHLVKHYTAEANRTGKTG